MLVSVLLLDGLFDTGLSTVLDTFEVANALSARGPLFIVEKVGVGKKKRVTTSQGLIANVSPAHTMKTRPDIALIPALGAKTPEAILERIERRDIAEAGELLRSWKAKGTRIAAACTATFVLAHAGLLDGQPATTTWWLAPTMRERFPNVALDESRMVVEAKKSRVVTVGAALAHVDLVLWLVRQRSPSIARATAAHMVIDDRPSQASFILPDFVAHTDAIVDKFERWARKNLSDFSMTAAARSIGASERTIERRLQVVLGKSPLSFVQDLRVEFAVHRLQTSDASLDEVATLVGYRDAATLRALLRKKIGRGVRELRARG